MVQGHYREEPVGRWCLGSGSRLLTCVLQYAPRYLIINLLNFTLKVDSMKTHDHAIASDREWTHRDIFTYGAAWTRVWRGAQRSWWKNNVR